ncbi:hypothetical protein OS176_09295 [Xanthomonadaceae bacterium XH05]|nr:hypothetical protein [Xanthomonadaceae bacterium XH05]
MSKLTLSLAPPPARPLRWLMSAPLWGMVAGAWLLLQGDAALLGRWSLQTVVLVHVFTLGVLGNAMLGSLFQFLPVAADTAMPLDASLPWLHAAFNLGLVLFVLILPHGAGSPAMPIASILLGLPPVVIALAALPALLRRGPQRMLRTGIGFSLCALVVTVAIGLLLVFLLRGALALPLDRIADVHAVSGLLGWIVGLMVAVGSVTLPMFQGTKTVPAHWLAVWIALCGIGLAAGTVLYLAGGAQAALILAVSPAALAFITASLWLPWRATRRRDTALPWFWRIGTLSLGAACLIGLSGVAWPLSSQSVLVAGMLGIGIGLPMMLIGMMLEIVPFLAWIRLRRGCPRGIRIPGAGVLLPERDKYLVLVVHLGCAMVLCGAAGWPALARGAGFVLLLTYAVTFACLIACLRRAGHFLRGRLAQHMPR